MMPGGRSGIAWASGGRSVLAVPGLEATGSGPFQVDGRVRSPVRLPWTCWLCPEQIQGGLLALPQAGPAGTVTPVGEPHTV